jgi:hypothetical protein
MMAKKASSLHALSELPARPGASTGELVSVQVLVYHNSALSNPFSITGGSSRAVRQDETGGESLPK